MDPKAPQSGMPAPTPEAAAHSERLRRLIVREIDAAGGWIGFDRYMELALYAPGLGYYTAGARKLGDAAAGGDFVTAPEISPLFARALAAQAAEVFERLGAGEPRRILEFGAGTGRLARDLLDELARRGVAVDCYQIVEVSADLRGRQEALLAGRPVAWLPAPPPAFTGVLIANEVLDVMPVRLFVSRDDGLRERGVASSDGVLRFAERPADASLGEACAAIESEVGRFAPGYASEVGLVARAWTAAVAESLERGVALLVDYGFPRREYYHPQRLMGTIMCHYRHRAHADPLWLPGLNDITAHVDFTSVAEHAHAAGCAVLGYTSQANFLMNCGLLEMLAAAQTPARTSAVQRLLSEAEMGELFKVLALGRGMEPAGDALRGFARGDRTHTL
jgi:SAM-dependent MidA family methyltransferase